MTDEIVSYDVDPKNLRQRLQSYLDAPFGYLGIKLFDAVWLTPQETKYLIQLLNKANPTNTQQTVKQT